MVDEQPWVSLTEAAQLTGLARDAIRAKARRGHIPSRKGNRGEVVVQIPAGLLARAGQGQTGQEATADQGQASLLATLGQDKADLLAEIVELREELATAVAERDAARDKVATAVAAKDELIVELKALLAEARQPWWRRLIG
jgi:hypothetical protein